MREDEIMGHLAAIVDSSDDAILSKSLEGVILSWNRAAEKLYGYTAEEMVGRHISALVPPDRPGELDDIFTRVRAGEAVDHFETVRVRKDGAVVPVSLTISPVRNRSGSVVAASTIARDIRERQEADKVRFQLAAIVDSSDDAILSKSLEGVILSWNRAAEKLFGYTAEEMVGRHISTLVPPDRPWEVDDILARLRAGEAVDHFVTVRVRKDGAAVPVSLTISPVLDRSGSVVAASTIARDIRERQEADKVRFQLAAIVDSSDDAILGKSLEGVILNWNRAAEKLFGYTAEEMVGRHISSLVPPDRQSEVEDILARVRAGEAVDHFETVRVRKDGAAVPVSLTISPVLDRSGSVAAASTIARDIRERNRLQAELEAARDQAMEVSRLKSDFLATMSHEIRTPMNGVIGMTGLLLDGELDPEQREYAETIRSSGEALLSIINDILDFSKIEAGKLDLELIDFDLRSVIEEVAVLLAEQAQSKGLELLTFVRPEAHTRVRGDPGRFRQILTNLVGNAVKFTAEGEIVIRASVANESGDDVLVRVVVTDTGMGIAPTALALLFEPFSQADASTTRIHGGTGLGLAICKQLIERMGGEITVDSKVGEGTTFTFTLRLGKQTDAADVMPAIARADLSGQRVLIVDDNATNRTILTHQVSSWGMPNRAAAGGAEALDLLRAAASRGEDYDVVLLDMDMPDMDGLQVAHALRDDPSLARIPIVMFTSAAIRGSGALAREAGIAAVLTKPVRQSHLLDAIATVMGGPVDRGTPLVSHDTLAESKARSLPRLLVAEDNPVNQMVTTLMLAKLGYRSDMVANGAEAVEATSRIRYGAVLMDCQMPEMDGYEASTEIRRRERDGEHVPIIAMTAAAMVGDRERCLAAGMDDYVPKPVKAEELGQVLARWVVEADKGGRSEARNQVVPAGALDTQSVEEDKPIQRSADQP